MPKPKVIFVVGHSNWGKSRTLRALTAGNHRVHRTSIANVEFLIRRMSNDDLPESFIKRMTSIDPSAWPYIIAALCPDFEDPSKGTEKVLNSLREKGYKLFFWVIAKQYGTSEIINPGELSRLRGFGKVEVFTESAEAAGRAKKLKEFVTTIGGV